MADNLGVPMSNLDRLLAECHAAPTFKAAGDRFELLTKWVLENAPEYKEVTQVWWWKEWPYADGNDIGIDLVAETSDKKLWAVQAKLRAATRLTKGDVDSFNSTAHGQLGPQPFDKLVLVSNCTELSAELLRNQRSYGGRAVNILYDTLDSLTVNYPATLADLDGDATVPVPNQPKEYQEAALTDIAAGFKTSDRGQLIMACGTGKTLVCQRAAEASGARLVLVAVPSLALLQQTLQSWLHNNTIPGGVEYRAVCSDKTVADGPVARETLGVPVTSDPQELATWMRRRNSRKAMRVVFVTYHSTPIVAAAQRQPGVPQFGLAIADEAHRTVGATDRAFSTILDSDAIRARRRLFATATPRIIRSVAQSDDVAVASMDDHNLYGPVFHTLRFGQAIKDELLSDYRVLVSVVTTAHVRQLVRRRRIVDVDGNDFTADDIATYVAVLNSMRDHNLRTVITFHHRIADAQRFAANLELVRTKLVPDAPPITTAAVDGQMSVTVRKRHIHGLSNREPDSPSVVVTNARCLTEGIDVPALDAVAFIDPKSSVVDVAQAVGRVLRKHGDKVGHVILPVHIDTDHDPHDQLDGSRFRDTWKVIQAISSHDETLTDELSTLRQQLGRAGVLPSDPLGKVGIAVAGTIPAGFADAITNSIVRHTTPTWDEMYGILLSRGFGPMPRDCVVNDSKFASWVRTQRIFRDRMSPERKALLDEAPGWTWDPVGDAWQRGYDTLLAHGPKQVSADYEVDGFPLGSWITRQRTNRHRMSTERRALLDAAPGWIWNAQDAAWREHYEALLAYGPGLMPQDYEVDGFRLGKWVSKQRSSRYQMSPERRALLDTAPGWIWDAREVRWRRHYDALLEHGPDPVPKDHEVDGLQLGKWISHQRLAKDRMSPERRDLLDAAPGWTWDARMKSGKPT